MARARCAALVLAMAVAGCQSSGSAPSAGGTAIEPASLIGRSEAEVTGALGQPDSARSELDTQVWQYAGPDCVVDLFIAPQGGSRLVAHAEARNRASGSPVTSCRMS